MKDQSDEFIRVQDGETDSGIEVLCWVSKDKQRTREVIYWVLLDAKDTEMNETLPLFLKSSQ